MLSGKDLMNQVMTGLLKISLKWRKVLFTGGFISFFAEITHNSCCILFLVQDSWGTKGRKLSWVTAMVPG